MTKLKLPIFAGILMLFILSWVSVWGRDGVTQQHGMLEVSFLDIGQGDATFIVSPAGTQVLIDGGADSRVLSELGNVMNFFDRDIDVVIATHPDADHIGGLIDVLLRYDVQTIVMTENINNTPVYDAFMKVVKEEQAHIIFARAGQMLDLGSGASGSTTLTVLFPDRDPTHFESNLSSIVSRLVYGESEYLFMGDSPIDIEAYLVGRDGSSLESDVLKVGHHGSRTSTSEIFLDAVAPSYAIISAGKGNSYGHPHKEVMTLLSAHSIKQKNTAEVGSIFSESNGATITFRE